jgi:flavin reductase (DIM6/NTAB) family NADH-FMN oxidoreductase RutF
MSFSSREFRDALGCFATGVCVITADTEGWPAFGVTANSFASVSLDPPLILWSLQNDSEMFKAWQATTHFAVNILYAHQQPLSDRYAKKGDHVLEPTHYESGDTGAPVMVDTAVTFECEVEAIHPGGDHTIIVGRVLAMHHRDAGEPLLFSAGQYRVLAP